MYVQPLLRAEQATDTEPLIEESCQPDVADGE
jgi:hypothetical protein